MLPAVGPCAVGQGIAYGFDSFHNQIKFESLRRGEIPPDLENQEPDEEE